MTPKLFFQVIDKLRDLIQKAEDTVRLVKMYFNANSLMLNAKKMYLNRNYEALITYPSHLSTLT